MKDTQSRKWLLTINNLDKHKITVDEIIKTMNTFKYRYFCLAEEVGKEGTPHIHIFIYTKTAVRFSTLKKRFPVAHIDKAYGTSSENRAYITKTGKWADTEKAETVVEGSFREYGEIPSPIEEDNPDMAQIIADIESGASNYDIITEYPKYGFKVNSIDAVRQAILSDKYRERMRAVTVTYIHGSTATGKTRSIYERFPAESICRITSYSKNGVKFDAYRGEDVLVFEEFASQIPIEDMLNYLDIYPIMLPARYNDKVACYTKVFITSNLPLSKQYVNIQANKPKTYDALLRRINYVETFHRNGKVTGKLLNKEVNIDERD